MTLIAAVTFPPSTDGTIRTVMMSDTVSHLPSGSRYQDPIGKIAKLQVRESNDPFKEEWNRTHDLIIGSCGSAGINAFTQNEFEPPALLKAEFDSPRKYVYKLVQSWKKQCFEDEIRKGHLIDSAGSLDGMMLIAFRGLLFHCFGDFSVGQVNRRYAAVGSGEDVAYGGLAMLISETTLMDRDPKNIMIQMRKGGAIASEHLCDVGGPFVFEFAEMERGEAEPKRFDENPDAPLCKECGERHFKRSEWKANRD